jgi:hypothetical protein
MHLLTRLRCRIGRRGAALLAFAFIDLVIGWLLLDPQSRLIPSYRAVFAVAPPVVWALLWIGAGLIVGVHAFLRVDKFGFAAAILIKLLWALGLMASWLAYHAPRGWVGAATWVVLAGLVLIIAGWPEPPRRTE